MPVGDALTRLLLAEGDDRPAPIHLGSTTPRLWTPPLRDLTPETSYGFAACEFATRLGRPLDPWQEWLLVHAGELLPDGRPRFRLVLVLVSRQNGKTELLVILSLFWLFEERRKLVLGTSLLHDAAFESWEKAVNLADATDDLRARIASVRTSNGQVRLVTADDCVYKIAAANRRAGRSKTINRLIMDEAREQDTWVAYNAAVQAMNAVYDGQGWLISNQGDDSAVVLDSLRAAAITFLETGEGDPRLGIFEYSAPDGSDPEDEAALAQANPNLGRYGAGRVDLDNLLGEATRAKMAGGEQLAGFKTEAMCMRVHQLNPAISPEHWAASADAGISLVPHRDRLALCLDVSLDGRHATLMAAAELPSGMLRVEVVKAWFGPLAKRHVRRELAGIVARVQPRVFGWFPSGPAASVAVDLADPRKRHGRRGTWPPMVNGRPVELVPIQAEVPSVCMGLADVIESDELRHPDDDLLNQHIGTTQKLWEGEVWRFARRGSGPIDGSYATAGAVHLVRSLPAAPAPLELA